MNKRKGIVGKYRNQIMIIFVCIMMIAGQFPMGNYVFAQSNGYMHTTISEETDIHTQKINISQVREGITKVELYKDGTLIETKPVSESLSFDVHKNGDYVLVGFNDTDTKQGEESVHVDSFDDLMIEQDEATHTVTIVSRYHSTFDITVNGKDSLGAAEVSSGVYQATYVVPKNGTYEFSVVDADGKVLDSSKLSFTDIPNISETGDTIISTADDLKQIIANPSGSFILDQDIELKEDILSNINFTGTLNGDGYTISGITNQLFDTVTNAKITNIVIKGRLSDNAVNTDITNTGFYVEANDAEKNTAVILNGTDVRIQNSFAFMNVEGKNAAGFILNGTGSIEDSYVSGYINAKEDAYGFGKEVNVKNSYITASLLGKKRVLFSEGEHTDCFYDAQINDVEDNKATPYYTKDMISGKLNNEVFTETEGQYPTLKKSKDFKEKAQGVSALSVLSVKTKSNLSALEGNVETEDIEGVDWDKGKDEITAESNKIINRFALKDATPVTSMTAGTSTDAKTTQVTFPMTMGTYYKVVKSSEKAPTLPASHKAAIESGWKIMYWSGSYKQSGLEWNTEYKVYSTNLETVSTDGIIKTAYGKNGGKVSLTGIYDFNETMTATLSGTNTTKGTMIWETADTLNKDAVWTPVQTTEIDGTTDTYKVTNNESSKYLRARFEADDTTGYKGTLTVSTDSIIKQSITEVTIENKTKSDGTFTFNDELVANMKPVGKENEVIFQWFYEGGNAETPIATGRNYQIKGDDVGKKLYVKAVAKSDGDFKDYKNSSPTSEVLAIQCDQPVATDHLTKVSNDDITVTLSMNTDSGLYRYGYKTNPDEAITPYSVLSRNKTNTTITGLSAHTTYYFYVQQVGENGYSDSAWSNDYITVTTDNDHVKGDILISGNTIYNQTLTASITNNPDTQTGKFVWYRLDSDGKREATPLATNTTEYTLTKKDIKSKIEVVYEGTGDYSGEISTITDSIDKEEKSAPTDNLTIGEYSENRDTTIKVILPTNVDEEKYIIGISTTQQGVPIEQLDADHKLLTFGSGETYIITGLSRDTDYYLSVRYAENETHQKSDWIKTDKVIKQRTEKKDFKGKIEFTYETSQISVMQGKTINAELIPTDTSFNNKGNWTWTKINKDGTTEVINNFTIRTFENGHVGTSYTVPDSEEIGTRYKVTFEANVGYTGSIEATSDEVVKVEKVQNKTPNQENISMEPIDDTSIKVKMTAGDGQYRFWYKKADQSAWDSFVGLLNKTFNDPNDGYKELTADGDTGKNVFANVDVVIDGLDRNTEYIVRVQRVEDDKGTASEFAYSTDKAEHKSVTTEKTEIAGYVSVSGTARYDETLTAVYNPATYASTGSDRDTDGTWQWYRGDTAIPDARSTTYKLVQEDIGQVIRVEYTIPENNSFRGHVDTKTAEIKKAVCVSPKITDIKDKENVSGKMSMEITGTASENEQHIYYRVQRSDAVPPSRFPTEEEIARDWKPVDSTTITVEQDANNFDLEPNTTYNIYFIKTATDTEEPSSILSMQHKMGTYTQKGTITFEKASDGKETFVAGQTVKATLTDSKNKRGTWKWYMSTSTYDGTSTTTMPSVNAAEDWEEITSGFSPILDTDYSELNLTEDMFAHYIRAEFVANEEYNYSGAVSSMEPQFVKKIYNETLTITSSTQDGNKNPKAYMNTVITGTINNYAEKGNVNRNTVQFKIGDTIIKDGITISRGKFTYTMPNDNTYKNLDGQEITAEISTPKIIELFVDNDLKPIATQTINSKMSTETSFNYTYGIPISNADDLEAFMKQTGSYTDRSRNSSYVITDNINISGKGIIKYSENTFASTLDGDYHTIVGTKNPLFALTNNATIKNIISFNSDIDTVSLGSGTNASASVITREAKYTTFYQCFMVDSNVSSGRNTGFLVGLLWNGDIESCGSVGGSASTTAFSAGSLAGWLDGNGLTYEGIAKVSNSYSVSTIVTATQNGGMVGGVIGGGRGPAYNVYAASAIESNNTADGGAFGQNAGTSVETSNIFYDQTLSPNPSLYQNYSNQTINDVHKGIPKSTPNMIGTELQNSFDSYNGNDNTWTYKKGMYPRLTWIENHPVVLLYSVTRGAFISVDGQTLYDDMFNGDISGVIQIPTELQTRDYSIKILNSFGIEDESVLKKGDNGTIIPVGNAGEKATVEITYTEPDETIGGSAKNTYEFTVKEQVKAMDNFDIVDTEETAYTSSDKTATLPSPQMNQTLKTNIATDTTMHGISYQWYRRKSGTTESEAIKDATSQTYTLTSKDVGYEFCVLVNANDYASTYSNYTKAVVSIQPDAPTVSEITDSSVKLKATNGSDSFKYEFGYMRHDQNAMITQITGTYTKDELVEVKNLQRNKDYDFYVRIAKAADGSYDTSDWSLAASETTLKTKIEGKPKLGTGINNGTELSLTMEATNGQTGTWSLKRMSADGNTEEEDIAFLSEDNVTAYTLAKEDVGKRIKAIFTGSGDFEGTVESVVSDVVQKETKDKPESPVKVSETDTTVTIKMEKAGTYDIGYSDSTSGEKTIVKEKVTEGTEVTIVDLKRNTDYYIYARYSETDATATSSWSETLIAKTSQTAVTGNVTELGSGVVVNGTIIFTTPAIENLTGTWKLERVTTVEESESATTISPSSYTIKNNTALSYKIDPKDAGNKLRVTFTGNGDFKEHITHTTDIVMNASQDIADMPTKATISSLKDYSFNIQADDGTSTYQFGYALKGQDVNTITTVEATGTAKTNIAITGLTRNTEYDIYVRKAAKTGYDAGEWKLITTQKTDRSTLTGTVEYVILDGTEEKPAKVGVADVGVTYKANYLKGTYAQAGTDENAGYWQWYANNKEIQDAITDTYKIQPMEGDVEITVKYIANGDSDFKESRMASIGTLTKPAYDAPNTLPTVTALTEDGMIGSRLQITNTEIDHVFYYVQKASNTTVPTTTTSSLAEENEAKPDQWFKATGDVTLSGLDANTEYVVYVARLEDGEHQSSGVISQRAVKTAKENLSLIRDISITEADDTKWKILQNKELRISNNTKSIDGVWQYYVTQNKADDSTWQNITSEVKVNTEEGTTDSYSYTKVNVPLKYANGFYIKAVFTGRGDYEGSQSYVSTETIIGTQIKGSAEISTGDSSQVFVPITVNYVYAKDAEGNDIKDEENGIWTWYRETAINSNTYEKISRENDTVGRTDHYTPTSEDVGKKLYAVYTGAPTGTFSGSVESSKISYIKRAEQTTPEAITLKQVNGTNVQISLPANMKTEGKTIAQPRLEYTIKGQNDWQKNGVSDAWINDLKANTEYEVRVRFEGTSEYEPSAYGEVITVKTGNQSFDVDHLSIEVTNTKDVFETGSIVTATFTGSGHDEGYFVIKRSDGTPLQEQPKASIAKKSLFKSGTNTIEYTVTSDDIGSNIIIEYHANADAGTYGGYIEKSTQEVAKPQNPNSAGTPNLSIVQFSKTSLTAEISNDLEYVLNNSSTKIASADEGEWQKLTPDESGKNIHTFTGLDENKAYYLHARYAETQEYRSGEQSVKTQGTSTWKDTTHSITYTSDVENEHSQITNDNASEFTELSEAIELKDASRPGYEFLGWTSEALEISTATKKITIPKNTTKDIDVKSCWKLLDYSISYNLNDGTLKEGETNPATYTIEDESFTLYNPEKKGYTFTGWTLNGETTPQTTVQIEQGSFGNKSFTANWKLNEYKISYELGGGTNADSNLATYTVESDKITISEPTKTGYDFLGWTWDGQTEPDKAPVINKGSIGDMTYTANWKATEYTITYNLDNGELETGKTNPEKYTIESDSITLNNPTRTGYTFKGWSTSDGDTPVETVTITKGSTGAKSYTAIWEATTYTITYIMDGGTNHADNPSGYKITDADITLKAPTRTGYVFKGWKADGTGEAQETVTIASGSTGNLSYTATWEKVEYTVIFDSKGGSEVSQAGVKFEEKITKPADPTKEGYTFAGWFKETTLGNEWNFDNDVVTANITLYAKWTVNEYQATFDVNGGDSVNPATITKNYQEELGALPVATRTGYSFAGWFTAATDGEEISATTKMPVNGATYYAHWTINQYTVKFDGNKGSDGVEIKKDYDAAIGELPTSTRTGYTFDGWYTEKSGGTKITEASKIPSKNTTYYAHWTINQYTVTFDGNGGSNGDAITADYDSELQTLPTSTREGYTFDGWYTAKTGGTKILTTTKMPLDGATYYAHWNTVDYTITYDLNDGNSGEAKNHENNPSKYTIESDAITLQNPTWTGRVFTGWTWAGHDSKELVVTIDKGTTGNKTYKANWELAAYTVTFDSQGGSDVADVPAQHGKPIAQPSDPVKEGYTFKGWYTTKEYAVAWNFEDAVMGNMPLYAKWEINHYAVSFNTNGGSSVDAQTVDHGNKAALPTEPTREHYEFAGWYSDDKLTTEFDFANTEIKGETTIYAKWTPVIYNITYDLDGGSVTLDKLNPIFYTVETESFTLNNPTKTGYEFKGWSTGDDSKAETTVTITKGTSGDLSYKAVWEKKSYTVTFDSKGGSAVEAAAIKYEEKITKPSDPTKAGYTFAGWYKETACENVWEFDKDVVSDETTLYAKWTANRYTALFDKNEGDTVSPASIEKDYLEELGTLPTATRTGYSFAGWFTAATGGNQITDKTKMPLDGTTYYAQWTINQYTVKFDGNGGSNGTDITADYDSELATLPTSSRAGYTFAGWYTEKIGGTKVETTTKVPAKDVTYYAHWTINQYTVKFDGNGGSNGTEITADYDSELGTLPTSTREGYTFEGWYTEKTGGTKILMTTKMPLDGATYYAQWKTVDYTITYDLNDGSSSEAVNHKDNPLTYTIESSEITLKAPSWKNHVFTGWTWDGHDIKEMVVIIDTGTTGNKTYKANWVESNLTVKFDTQGGSAVEDVPAGLGVPITKPDDPTREGYTFKGWYTSTTYETEWNFDDNVMDNMTLHAKWEINHYDVTFDTNGGNDIDKQTIDHGGKANKPADPTKEYYAFAGWYSDEKLTKEFKFDSAIKATTTLYAKWTPVKYDITYELDGGENHKDNPATYTIEDEITLKAPVKKNYTFLGWTYKGQSEPQMTVTIIKGTHDALSYTANWKLNEYAVDFKTNSDDVIASITVQHGDKITRPEKEPVKAGYVFNGWYSDKECTKAWDFDKNVVTGKTTLYAGYKEILKSVESDTKSETNVNKGDTVKLTAPKGADIYFTVDGKEPSKSSEKYNNGIIVNETMTIKAIAVKDGYADSSVATFIYYVKGKVSVDTEDSLVEINNKPDELIEAVLQEDEYKEYLTGTDVMVRISCKPIDKIEDKEVMNLLDGRTPSNYYDITVYKTVGDKDEVTVETLQHPIHIVLDVPEELYPETGVTREFKVLRIHEGNNALLDDLDEKLETVTFESDAFSSYILCYKDVSKDEEVVNPVDKPKTDLNEIKKGDHSLTAQQPAAGDEQVTAKEEEPEKKLEKTEKEKAKEKEEAKNTVYFFLIPIALLLAMCIAFIAKIKHKSAKK